MEGGGKVTRNVDNPLPDKSMKTRKTLALLFAAAALAAPPVLISGDEAHVEDKIPRPGPPPEVSPESVFEAVERGIGFLVESQNPNGSWGGVRRTKGLNIAAQVPGSHHAFTVATTALAVEALCLYPQHSEEAEAAIDLAQDYLLEFLPRVRRASGVEIYNVWTHSYAIKALLQLHERAGGDDELQARLAEAIQGQVNRLESYQFVNGGWGYYNFGMATAVSSGEPTSFTTGTALIALRQAKDAGYEVSELIVERALRSMFMQRLPDGSFVYSFGHRMRPRSAVSRPAGGLARAQVCNAAGRMWTGDEHISDQDMIDWLDRMITRGFWLDQARKRPRPHEGHFANAGYYFYYGYYYAGEVGRLLSEADFAPRRNHLKQVLINLQERDGSWWDFPLYDYHQPYGTALALSALYKMTGEVDADKL